jgi:GNAT superfamily N-acetyltransferase
MIVIVRRSARCTTAPGPRPTRISCHPAALNFGSPAALGEWWSERWTWERETHRLTVAVDGDRIVGFTYLGPSDVPGVMELSAIHVEPSLVGTGVGKLLMADALSHLGESGGVVGARGERPGPPLLRAGRLGLRRNHPP